MPKQRDYTHMLPPKDALPSVTLPVDGQSLFLIPLTAERMLAVHLTREQFEVLFACLDVALHPNKVMTPDPSFADLADAFNRQLLHLKVSSEEFNTVVELRDLCRKFRAAPDHLDRFAQRVRHLVEVLGEQADHIEYLEKGGDVD